MAVPEITSSLQFYNSNTALDNGVRTDISSVLGSYARPPFGFYLSVNERSTDVGLAEHMPDHHYDIIAVNRASLAREDRDPRVTELCSEESYMGNPLYKISMEQGSGYVKSDENETAEKTRVDICRVTVSFCLDTGAFLLGDSWTEILSHITVTANLKMSAPPAEVARLLASILWLCLKRIIETWYPLREEYVDIRNMFGNFLGQHKDHANFGEVIGMLQSEFGSKLADFLARRAEKM